MLTRQSIRIRVVHGDDLVKTGLLGSLRRFADFEVVRDDEPDRDLAPQVVVADLGSAMDIAHGLARHGIGQSPKIVVVSGPDRERDLRQALEFRIQGYLVSGFTLDELADGVRVVSRGARYLCPRAAARLAESSSFSALTDREEEVLDLVSQGLCNKSIAQQLDVALGTVKSHLKSAYGKLFVASRTQAVVVSERRGLLARRDAADLSVRH